MRWNIKDTSCAILEISCQAQHLKLLSQKTLVVISHDFPRWIYPVTHKASLLKGGKSAEHLAVQWVWTRDGLKHNGNLLYTIRPIQLALDQFYEQQLAQMDAAAERQRSQRHSRSAATVRTQHDGLCAAVWPRWFRESNKLPHCLPGSWQRTDHWRNQEQCWYSKNRAACQYSGSTQQEESIGAD